jgi:predicted FMN-binding regulatory protein PaiB
MPEGIMYPPEHHIEEELEKVYRVIEAFSFATVISRTEDDLIVTQIPLILDREKGQNGSLIGHIDKNNPHANYLNNKSISVIFHGPNTYISPTVYESAQLPTWNSISVHIKGTVNVTESVGDVRDSIIKMTSLLERGGNPYVLEKNNEKMTGWLNHIIGFNIEINEIVGRFKLSQDKSSKDMELAKQHLILKNKIGYEDIINFVI